VARHPPSGSQVRLAGTRLRAAVALHSAFARDHLSGASEDQLLSTGRLATAWCLVKVLDEYNVLSSAAD
jgi:hypothetical protein